MINFASILKFPQFLGKKTIDFNQLIGRNFINLLSFLTTIFSKPFYFKRLLEELINIGITSTPIVAMTALFSGSVLALQSYVGFSQYNASESIPLVVVLSTTRELGPVLTGLMLSGRIASNIASEIGAMRITDQLDAIKIIGIEKNQYLLRPKLFAMILFMPILTIISDVLGIFGGYLVSIYKLGFNKALYIKATFDYLKMSDIYYGIIKSFYFGIIIILIGYLSGLYAQKNSHGTGIATRNAVVYSTVCILIANYVLTYLLFE
jgi:phospholipid/cholesterol/gamma-HCH transport system permease protein